ncbi:DNA-binding SARP family transcriptional activator [Asanoa ferruginea]|uniref:DNA-binding SARP family transcriptional activator n=1 Tax=Asanoa ferruginea TaxID=53367 RepID=A0A3D9ZFE3_9ACTN|nr:BTAD domain-containing putative transcriptional regulator [Asanoa ferruginea]REF95967.1 DNA-binding SARP family transcriptional activator [Asanoa ferruginea]GIF48174.1 SARP family transcriptional regulator [Asanoa ferruginea]
MEFTVLGPVEIIVDEQPLSIGGIRNRLVLAGLLLRSGRPVGVAPLIDLVWDDPPATARQQLHTAVSALRRALGGHGRGPAAAALRTVDIGYQLDVPAGRLDLQRFTSGLADARAHRTADALPDAAKAYQAALALWRGPALAGLPGAVVARYATELEEQRLAAVEEWCEVELGMGLHRPLVPRLRQLSAEHPERERFGSLLMTALVRDGRRPEAIAVYHELAKRLRDELGIDPGELLNAAYLTAIADRPRPAPNPPAEVLAPRYLPRAPRLVGRERELGEIRAAIAGGAEPRVVMIDGMAGVGKSALALTVARSMVDRYPDAQLFVDLQGHSEQQPVSPHEALGTLLRQVEPARDRMPAYEFERLAAWQRALRGRRSIVVLDNAEATAQIEPMLNVDAACLILVTSRTRLAPVDGALSLSLDVLDPADAVELLRHTADDRVDDDAAAAAAIVALCGRLPLAIRLVGHRLRQRPRWTMSMMRERLVDAQRAPITISVEGYTASAAFQLSYRHLSERQQLMFRRLGLHPAGTFEVWAAAALIDLPVPDTTELLDDLVEANLVQADIPGRYRMHDLLRAFAATLVSTQEHRPATVRMLDGYLRTLEAAGHHLERHRPPSDTVPAGGWLPQFGTAAEGAAWADANWSTIVTLVNIAERADAHRHTALLARMAYRSADVSGRSADGLQLAAQALAAADALGDDDLTATTHGMVAALYLRLGHNEQCRASIEWAIRHYENVGNEHRLHRLRVNQVTLLRHEGRHREAVRIAEDVLRLVRAAGDRLPEMGALLEGGAALHQLGRHEAARAMLVEAAHTVRDRDTHVLSIVLGWLGCVHIDLGQPAAAAIALTWAVSLKRQHGNLGGAAEALADLGRLFVVNGHPEIGLRQQQQAYEQARALDDGYYEPILSNHLGETLTVLGRHADALDYHRAALRLAERRRWPYERARAQAGIAAALRATDPRQADAAQAEAIGAFIAIGLDTEAAQAKISEPARVR